MELIIDNNFKRTYEIYYGRVKTEIVLDMINETFAYHDPEMIVDTVNIIKTSMALGFTYSRCYDEVIKKILHRFPVGDDIDKFVVSLVLKIMVVSGSPNIEELMKSPRNIEREVASKHFRVTPRKVTTAMVEEIKAASSRFNKDSYSVTDTIVDGWDDYFYNICRQVARNSKCMSRRIGAVMVKDKSIISTGYNGPPRGVPRCDMRWKLDDDFTKRYLYDMDNGAVNGRCPRHVLGYKSGEGLDICLATHAEVNSVVNAAMQGIATKDASLYMSCGIPCHNCMQVIINAGIKEIIVTSLDVYDESAIYLLKQSDVGIRLFDFIK